MKNIIEKEDLFEKQLDGKILEKTILVSEINQNELQLRIDDSKKRIDNLQNELNREKKRLSALQSL